MSHNKQTINHSAAQVFLTFLKLGLTSFGGPIAHIGYFRKELVEKQGWVNEAQFAQILAICQFLPGPASSQLGFALGLFRAGSLGAIAAFLAFTLPSALLLVCFAGLLPYLSSDLSEAIIHGLKLVACAVVMDAVLNMSKKLCPDTTRKAIAVVAMTLLIMIENSWSQVLVIVAGAVAGLLLCKTAQTQPAELPYSTYGKRFGTVMFIVFLLLLLILPALSSSNLSLIGIADIFYQAGALVFGGGHVVLPLLENSVVASGTLDQQTFLAGYGASQAIPGPMFSFAAFVGAMLPSDHASMLVALIALLFIFLPGFLLLIAFLPFWQIASQNTKTIRAISGTNAAVVGLLAAALYDPILKSGLTGVADLAIALFSFAMLALWNRSPLIVVLWCVSSSVILSLV